MWRIFIISVFLYFVFSWASFAQENIIYGKLVDELTRVPIAGVEVFFPSTDFMQTTDKEGSFVLRSDKLPLGEGILVFRKYGYETKYLPIVIYSSKSIDLGQLFLSQSLSETMLDKIYISLSEQDLDYEAEGSSSISGLLSASREVFSQAAAFDFSLAYFSPRGYDSGYSKMLLNGVSMNRLKDSRPLWSSWGGLNELLREQTFSMGLSANPYAFGGLAGTTNIALQASLFRKGGRLSYAAANATYTGRTTASYHTGMLPNNWAFSLMLSRRFAKEAYIDASLYDANSIFIGIERKLHPKHSLNFIGIYTPNRVGRSSANTQEVYGLKHSRYNSYWGVQDGRKRNSRIRKVEEPILMLHHYWQINAVSLLNINLASQFGTQANTSLGFDNVRNPDPTYYQKLPSYFLENAQEPNNNLAYISMLAFQKDGQINWEDMYLTNRVYEGPARYYLYEDRTDEQLTSVSSIFTTQLFHFNLSSSVNYRKLRAKNYASMLDLLGAVNYLDIDVYQTGEASQNDLNNPDRLLGVGDRFRYNYLEYAEEYNAFLQIEASLKKLDYYLALDLGQTQYQRQGLYRNGAYKEDSYAKSAKLTYPTYGAKFGLTHKISARHFVLLQAAYYTKAPSLRNAFPNPRQSNLVLADRETERIFNTDLTYLYRSVWLKARLTGYYTKLAGISQIASFYADGLSGVAGNISSAYVQEQLTGIVKQHIGLELGLELNLNPAFRWKLVGALGQFSYANNPDVSLSSSVFDSNLDLGQAFIKNYRLAVGPEQAFQLGFDYRSPNYWWLGITANHFSKAYASIVPSIRTQNFYTDKYSAVLLDYDEALAREMLRQEKLPAYMLFNAAGGKSWKKGAYLIGLYASVNNLLNQTFKIAAYEQARNFNYQNLKQDLDRELPFFGTTYRYGKGTTYFLSLSLGF